MTFPGLKKFHTCSVTSEKAAFLARKGGWLGTFISFLTIFKSYQEDEKAWEGTSEGQVMCVFDDNLGIISHICP